LPAVRAALSIIMINDLNASIYDTAKALGITPAAVSNYISGKRGSELVDKLLSNDKIRYELEDLAKKLAKKEASHDDIIEFLCKICKDVKCKIE